MKEPGYVSRRRALTAAAAALCSCADTTPKSNRAAGAPPGLEKIRYSDLLLHELKRKLEERAIGYIPLGTLEQHGPHLAVGADAIQSEALMLECARRYGGVVFPPIHFSPGPPNLPYNGTLPVKMDFWDIVFDPASNVGGDTYWVPDVLYGAVIDGMLAHCKRIGFRAVFADGHGPSRREWVRELKRRQDHFGLRLFGITTELLGDWKSQTDHAARNETSLMLHYRPDLVEMSRLPESRTEWPSGVGKRELRNERGFVNEDPRDATAEHGKACMEASVRLLIRMFRDAGV